MNCFSFYEEQFVLFEKLLNLIIK